MQAKRPGFVKSMITAGAVMIAAGFFLALPGMAFAEAAAYLVRVGTSYE
ncbi:MAG: hypothetical protein HY514_01220 [Candidatus Aenigmarchaeota archaeon]|nr:hypothetical protein [Candidatus Aenigmarchaeota archaeon]